MATQTKAQKEKAEKLKAQALKAEKIIKDKILADIEAEKIANTPKNEDGELLYFNEDSLYVWRNFEQFVGDKKCSGIALDVDVKKFISLTNGIKGFKLGKYLFKEEAFKEYTENYANQLRSERD
jgi:hypothetical protein